MLKSELISNNPEAPVIVLFGGNSQKRDFVIDHLKPLGDISIYGTLSEEEGYEKITTLAKVDLVLIGGRYTNEQRVRIRTFVAQHLPNSKMTEPGIDYPYEEDAIYNDVRLKLNL